MTIEEIENIANDIETFGIDGLDPENAVSFAQDVLGLIAVAKAATKVFSNHVIYFEICHLIKALEELEKE